MLQIAISALVPKQMNALDVILGTDLLITNVIQPQLHAQQTSRSTILLTWSVRGLYMIQTTPALMAPTTQTLGSQIQSWVVDPVIVVRLSSIIWLIIGKYCPNRGAVNFAGPCASGYYCTTNSSFAKPNPQHAVQVDYFKTTYGGYCVPGQYCP